MKILICGSRDWSKYKPIEGIIDGLSYGDTVINGGARGADSIAKALAEVREDLKVETIYAKWQLWGKSAGFRRNIEMLEEKPDIVYAFPLGESKGTWHTIREARERGIKTIVYGENDE